MRVSSWGWAQGFTSVSLMFTLFLTLTITIIVIVWPAGSQKGKEKAAFQAAVAQGLLRASSTQNIGTHTAHTHTHTHEMDRWNSIEVTATDARSFATSVRAGQMKSTEQKTRKKVQKW